MFNTKITHRPFSQTVSLWWRQVLAFTTRLAWPTPFHVYSRKEAIGLNGLSRISDQQQSNIGENGSITDLIKLQFIAVFTCFNSSKYLSNSVSQFYNLNDSALSGRSIMYCFYRTVVAAALIPNLSGIISLVGAFSSSALALIFPPVIEIITFWPDKLGKHDWKLWKDVIIMIFGITGFVFGTYASIENILYPNGNI